jgi:hypothetical protein
MLLLAAPVSAGQAPPPLPASGVKAFIGTWVMTMTNPDGTVETVRIWDKNGVAAASVQAGKFPPIEVKGIFKDGEMLVLTASRFENGKPIWSVIALTLDGDTMTMAQMLQFSQTIKRGSGKKQ